jgi:hypothetical protein
LQVLPESPEVHRFTVAAEYCQFYLTDLQAHEQWMLSHAADPDLSPGGWTREASQLHRVAVEPHSLSVGTARDDMVETTLRIHPADPQSRVEDAEHIVEADIDLPNGDMAICSVADDPGQERRHISLAHGRYRVRVSYVPTSPPAEPHGTGYGDYFIYQLDLWPTSNPAPLVVHKQGPDPWAL